MSVRAILNCPPCPSPLALTLDNARPRETECYANSPPLLGQGLRASDSPYFRHFRSSHQTYPT